jgi:hypothetical protein
MSSNGGTVYKEVLKNGNLQLGKGGQIRANWEMWIEEDKV